MNLATGRSAALFLTALLLQSCGGGGGGAASSEPNRPPAVAVAVPVQHLLVGHPFSFDVSQDGRTFVDPDGDRLSYQVSFNLPAPDGLAASGSVVSGTPTEANQFTASIVVTDGRGGEASTGMTINVGPNQPPVVVNQNPDRVLAAGESVDYDVTRGGTVFADADGDALAYTVEFAAQDHGLSIVGTRVTGTLNGTGLARIRVIARDVAGDTAEDAFSLAREAPEPGAPNLPDPPFIYSDDEVGLPYLYELSREHLLPFPDTTPDGNPITNAGATLGRVLFYDKRLSITNTVACGNCHKQSLGFSAGERFSVGALGVHQTRNAMSLANVRYNEFDNFFWDQRVNTLETLALLPIQEPTELGNALELLIPKLSSTGFYPPLFEEAFGSPEITADRIARAIAQFLRSMISYTAKSDAAFLVEFEGDIPDPSQVFSAQEFRGLEVASQSFCFSCHANDILVVTAATSNGLDAVSADPGQGDGLFHPPSLKNIRLTGPYMHDGRFETLREVIDFYDQGIQDAPRLHSFLRDPLTNLPLRFNLSENDKDALEAFLDTLTDQPFLTDPRFSDPFE